ncbi:MAG: N4-gp56 family major capsid protein [Patescibacteria group bacterium]|nr:N4-gp56 family major capsid protein [Patescibacteria group bacterium]
MTLTTTSTWSSNLLINYVTSIIRVLEPNLEFAKLGVKKDVPKGFATLAFPQPNQIATSSVGSITEGVNPTATGWNSAAYTSGITQYGIVIQVTDVLVRNSAIEVVDNCSIEVKNALSRELDNFIQTTVNGSSYGVIYAGGKATRAALGSGDLIDTALYTKAIRNLAGVNNNGLKPFAGGYYAVVAHPNQEYDLMNNTSAGGWLDTGRYTSTDQLLEGKMGDFRGGRVMRSPNVQTFSSTVTVYPMTVLGRESFGWGFFQPVTPIIVTSPDSNNPLNLYTSIGGKFGAGVTRFEDSASSYRIARIESAASS